MKIITRRPLSLLLLTGLAGMLVVAGPAHAAPRKPYRTCVPRRVLYWGAYRTDNDLFAGSPGRMCITSRTGHDLTVATALQAGTRGVVAYPNVRFGPAYGSGDSQSGLPQPIAAMPWLVLRTRAGGDAGGRWITDADAWFFPTANVAGHGNREVVIVTRSHDAAGGGVRVKVWNRWYAAESWVTCVPGSRVCWPIIVFTLARQARGVWIRLAAFVNASRRLGWMPAREWLGSAAFGTEIWSGGRGLSDSLTVKVGIPPVIRKLGPVVSRPDTP